MACISTRRKPPEEEGKGTDGEKGRLGVTALARATPGDIEVRVGGALDPRVMPRDARFSLQRGRRVVWAPPALQQGCPFLYIYSFQ